MPGKTKNGADAARLWSLSEIQELLDLLARKEITEFEMEQQGVKIRVLRGTPPVVATAPNGYAAAPAMAPVAVAAGPAPVAAPAAAAEPAAESTEGLFVMKSPIVGTFYGSPAPNAPPFVKVGDSVQVGQVICIIEAMKLMNELEAEVAGQVARVYVESGQPVEYGQTLFAIEPIRTPGVKG